MEFLRSIGETVNGAVDFVVEKNRKFSKVTRIKKLIKKESNSVIKAYITLGKHYYNELRDVPNYDMQKLCDSIDNSKREIKKLKEKLEEVNNEVNLSEFEDLIENEEPIEVEVTLSDMDPEKETQDIEETIENNEDK